MNLTPRTRGSPPVLSEQVSLLPPLLTVEQAADVVQMPVKTVYDLAARGVIPRVKLGRAVRVPRDPLLALVKILAAGPASPKSS